EQPLGAQQVRHRLAPGLPPAYRARSPPGRAAGWLAEHLPRDLVHPHLHRQRLVIARVQERDLWIRPPVGWPFGHIQAAARLQGDARPRALAAPRKQPVREDPRGVRVRRPVDDVQRAKADAEPRTGLGVRSNRLYVTAETLILELRQRGGRYPKRKGILPADQ